MGVVPITYLKSWFLSMKAEFMLGFCFCLAFGAAKTHQFLDKRTLSHIKISLTSFMWLAQSSPAPTP